MYDGILFVWLAAILVETEILAFEQNGYIIENDHFEVMDVNKEIVSIKVANFKFNRTVKAINLTFQLNQDILSNFQIEVQGYRFASNEYRLFPVSFNVELCDTLKKNEFGLQNIYQCGNFHGCPIKYFICNWTPDYSKFPPNVPPGDYMAHMKITNYDKLICVGKWFFNIHKRVSYG